MRAMVGEYSRKLSTKVFKGQCRLIELGYRQGGQAGYGLRRMLINQSGESKGARAIGERKSLQTDRVTLVPGPNAEVDTHFPKSNVQLFLNRSKSNVNNQRQEPAAMQCGHFTGLAMSRIFIR